MANLRQDKALMRMLLLLLSLLHVGCAGHSIAQTKAGSRSHVPPTTAFYVAIPEDGHYGGKTYAGSGAATARAISAALSMHFTRVETAKSVESTAAAIQSAHAADCSSLVYATILNWEDRATEWSGKLDRIEIKVEVIAVPSGETLRSDMLQANSGWLTLGGDRPQDLLRGPVDAFAKSLTSKR
jgi:hypothetical protein